jgi:hypothetical protein
MLMRQFAIGNARGNTCEEFPVRFAQHRGQARELFPRVNCIGCSKADQGEIRRLPFQRTCQDPRGEARTGPQDATTKAAHGEEAPDDQ